MIFRTVQKLRGQDHPSLKLRGGGGGGGGCALENKLSISISACIGYKGCNDVYGCGSVYNPNNNCQCDTFCMKRKDCCEDYDYFCGAVGESAVTMEACTLNRMAVR